MKPRPMAYMLILGISINTTLLTSQIVSIIGTGYVGLVTGACLAELNKSNDYKFVCLDIDAQKIERIHQGIMPIYEPGLEKIVLDNIKKNKLIFSTNLSHWLSQSDVIFIAVGTPTHEDGSIDMSYINSACEIVKSSIGEKKPLIITKSTVPVGTSEKLSKTIGISKKSIVSNPEFLREGTAVKDCMNPDRIVCGVYSEFAENIMRDIYKPLIDINTPFIVTDPTTSEMVKYVSNCFLALKLSYINEIANLCEVTGANIKDISLAVGLDKRINPHFLNPGPGYGGSCLPKDTAGFIRIAHELGMPIYTVDAAFRTNHKQKLVPYKKLKQALGNELKNKTVCILGLSFKANTDDIRYAASLSIIKKLLLRDVQIHVHDPAAMENMKKIFPGISYFDNPFDACAHADAVLILTEWNEYIKLDYKKVLANMRGNVIIDSRNILDINAMQALPCNYIGYGISKSL